MESKIKRSTIMNYVMLMSTDGDILNTPLNRAWNPIAGRFLWNQVSQMNLELRDADRIIAIAHGNGTEIGNQKAGRVDIDAETFLALVQSNIHDSRPPLEVYISTCGEGIAEFAAAVYHAAKNNNVWKNTAIYGHSEAVAGQVPPPGDISWFGIFDRRR